MTGCLIVISSPWRLTAALWDAGDKLKGGLEELADLEEDEKYEEALRIVVGMGRAVRQVGSLPAAQVCQRARLGGGAKLC